MRGLSVINKEQELTFAQECNLIANGDDLPYQLPRDKKIKQYRITYIDLEDGYKHEYYTKTKNIYKAMRNFKKYKRALVPVEAIKIELLER